jgi:predicted DNA-binding protein
MPPKQNVSIRLTDDQRARLGALAEAESTRAGWPVTAAAVLRRALDAGLDLLERELRVDAKRRVKRQPKGKK